MILVVPAIQQAGARAAQTGTHMSSFSTPQGFCFCPYRDESVERANFIGGAAHFYMGADVIVPGERP